MVKVKYLDPYTDLPITPLMFIGLIRKGLGREPSTLLINTVAAAVYKIVALAAEGTLKGSVTVTEEHIDGILKSYSGAEGKFRAVVRTIFENTIPYVGDDFDGQNPL